MRALRFPAVFPLSAVFLLSCEPISEPEYAIPEINLGENPVTEIASGSGQSTRPDDFIFPGYWRTFSFNVRAYLDGTVDGMFQWNDHKLPSSGMAAVTCMSTAGNRAWIGGVVTQHSNPDRIGSGAIFAAEDNGQGGADPDRITYVYTGLSDDYVRWFCNAQHDFSDAWVELEAGNVVIKD